MLRAEKGGHRVIIMAGSLQERLSAERLVPDGDRRWSLLPVGRMTEGMTRVLLVDDHPVVREGVAGVLTADPDIEVVAEAGNAEETFAAIAQHSPDVVMIDVRLPGLDGIDCCGSIVTKYPRVKVIILTRFANESVILRAFTAGARGFVVKESEPQIFRQAVRSVVSGGIFLDPRVTGKVLAIATKGRRARGPYGLTIQQMRVLELLPKGLSNREIAKELGISDQTVKTHLRHAMRKLQAGDRAEAAAIIVAEGLA